MDSVLAELAPSDAGPVPDADPCARCATRPFGRVGGRAATRPDGPKQAMGAEGGAMGAPSVSTPFMPGQVLVPPSEGERADPMAKIPLGAGPEFLPDTRKTLGRDAGRTGRGRCPGNGHPPRCQPYRWIGPSLQCRHRRPRCSLALLCPRLWSANLCLRSWQFPEKLMAAPALPGQRADAENATANFVSSIARGLGSGQVPKPAANLPIRAIGPAMSAPRAARNCPDCAAAARPD